MTLSDSPSDTAYASGQRHKLALVRDRVQLAACLSLPPARSPLPCVIFAHGAGSSGESLAAAIIGRRLLEAGIATLLFDLSGEGASTADPRQGDDAHVEDMEAVFKWIRARPEIDPDRLAVAASGAGCVIALRAVRRRLVAPSALVLIAPQLEPCGFVGVPAAALVIAGSGDPALEQIRTVVNWSNSATLRLIEGAGSDLENGGALESAAAMAVDWFERHFAAGDEAPGYDDIGPGD